MKKMLRAVSLTLLLCAGLAGCSDEEPRDNDLAVSVSTTSTTATGPLHYEVKVINKGPTAAGALAVIHTLPEDTTFTSAHGDGWTCSEAQGKVKCERAELEVDVAPLIEIDAVAPLEGGTAVARTTVSPFADPDISNNEAITSTIVLASAELAIAVTGQPDPTNTSGMIWYAIHVANQGPSMATEVSVHFDAVSGLTFLSGEGQAWTCYNASTMNCSLDALRVGAAPMLNVIAQAPASPGMIMLHGNVSASSTDPVLTNNEFNVPTTIVSVADLSLTMTDSPDPVSLGGRVMYSLTVVNGGPTTANAVNVSVQLAAGTTFDNAGGNGWSCGAVGQTVTCTRASLPAGTSYLNVNVFAPSSPGTITTTASLTSTSTDPVPSNNSASTSTTVAPAADLSVTVTDSPDPVPTSSTLTYTVNVQNLGPSTATSIVVTDTLPTAVTFQSASGPGWLCAVSGRVVTCSQASLAVGAAGAISIAVTTPATSAILQNDVSVSGTTADMFPSNNTAGTYSMVQAPMASADLAIAMTVSPDPVPAGAVMTYSVVVTNNGPDPATSVSVSGQVPVGTTFSSAGGTGWSCSVSGGVLTCTLPSLAVGVAPTITIALYAPATPGTVLNLLQVTSSISDPVMNNNGVSLSTMVTL
jgi:uncharacterized repeat protein (TIGR01451 family)